MVMLGLNYGPDRDPLASLAMKDRATISVYARNRDYHGLIKGRLKGIASRFEARTGSKVKVFVDTAPLMEKPLAAAAGIGWQGKHTNLVSRDFGSWLFLGAILTDAELPAGRAGDRPLRLLPRLPRHLPDQRVSRALPARCAALHLLPHHRARGADPARVPQGHGQPHLWLRRLPRRLPLEQVRPGDARGEARRPRRSRGAARSPTSWSLDDAGFRARFSGSPVKRIGRDRFVRNVLVAIGNSGDAALVPLVEARLGDGSPLVRGAAVWALGQLDRDAALAARAMHATEGDGHVKEEWDALGKEG